MSTCNLSTTALHISRTYHPQRHTWASQQNGAGRHTPCQLRLHLRVRDGGEAALDSALPGRRFVFSTQQHRCIESCRVYRGHVFERSLFLSSVTLAVFCKVVSAPVFLMRMSCTGALVYSTS